MTAVRLQRIIRAPPAASRPSCSSWSPASGSSSNGASWAPAASPSREALPDVADNVGRRWELALDTLEEAI